jgi:hypothetical protein
MAAFTPEQPRFEPRADYLATLQAFGTEFAAAAQDNQVFDTGEGIRVIAGVMAATNSLATLKGAETLELVVVEHAGEGATSYNYDLRHKAANDDAIGDPVTGVYWSNFTDQHLLGHTAREGERMRDLLEAAKFTMWDAMLAAPDHVHSESIGAALTAENITVAGARTALRRNVAPPVAPAQPEQVAPPPRAAGIARWLGWLGRWKWWGE